MSKRTYKNPILPGFYPDPSICRVGDDYYLTTSTFEYFPGLPIFHSKDLVHWQQIGHALDRPSQLPLDGLAASRGLYAPTIRYHDCLFYISNTLVLNDDTYTLGQNGDGCRNFIVTAENPAGPWSEPYWLDNAPGIDPSLLFDDDGRVWYTGNRIPLSGESYPGHREIWLQELDLNTMQLIGESYSLWAGAAKSNLHAEAPHLFKKDGYYYLLIAEGGTGHTHAVTISRSRQITGPYEVNHQNPILTHRHLGQKHPIVGTGHADMVETQNGEWWMVLLAMRPYDGYYYNLGRETFLVPMNWEDGWPIVNPGVGRVEFEHQAPDLPEHRWPLRSACDRFEGPCLGDQWNFIRTPREKFWQCNISKGGLRLQLRPEKISERVNPSFIGRRQQHINFQATTAMTFTPQSDQECAGVVLLQSNEFHFRVELGREKDEFCLRLIKRKAGQESIVAQKSINTNSLFFRVSAIGQNYKFEWGSPAGEWHTLAADVDGRILSTPVADGFVGAYIGMYASSQGTASQNHADFAWFEYIGLES